VAVAFATTWLGCAGIAIAYLHAEGAPAHADMVFSLCLRATRPDLADICEGIRAQLRERLADVTPLWPPIIVASLAPVLLLWLVVALARRIRRHEFPQSR